MTPKPQHPFMPYLVVTTLFLGIVGYFSFTNTAPTQNLPTQDQILSQNEKSNEESTVISKQELISWLKSQNIVIDSQSESLDELALIEAFESLQQEPDLSKSEPRRTFLEESLFNHDSQLSHSGQEFSISDELKPYVNFWRHIFGIYDRNQVVIYHQDDVSLVYGVLDFTDEPITKGSRVNKEAVENEITTLKHKIDLAEQGMIGNDPFLSKLREYLVVNNLTAEELKRSITWRTGYAHQMKYALKKSGAYMNYYERIFKAKGLPPELAVIPFVESSFSIFAESHAGARGIWQFMPETAKRYLKIDAFADERLDPLASAYAAAEHLANEYKLLKSWPLTVNAYNAGPGRLMSAVNTLATKDIATIIKKFKGSGYGYDSRNYYPEFLAVLEIYQNKYEYFPDLSVDPSLAIELMITPVPLHIPEFSASLGLSPAEFASLNPALSRRVLTGESTLPPNYVVTIPASHKSIAQATFERFRITPQVFRPQTQEHVPQSAQNSNDEAPRIQ